MSHDYHVENGLPNEVIDHFRDNEDEILVVNNDDNINNNDNNDIQFLSKPTTTENVYHSYPNCTDVGDNQVIENFDYMHFLDLPQQSKSQDGELYVGQWFRQLEDLKHPVKMWHIKNHVTFKHKRCVKDTWALCCRAEGCQWKLKVSERKKFKSLGN